LNSYSQYLLSFPQLSLEGRVCSFACSLRLPWSPKPTPEIIGNRFSRGGA